MSKKFVPTYNKKLVATTMLGKTKESTYIFSKGGKKDIEINDIKKIYEKLSENIDENKIRIRGLNAKQWYTLKGMDEPDMEVEDYEDYFRNRVKDPTKFSKFFQIEVTILSKQK